MRFTQANIRLDWAHVHISEPWALDMVDLLVCIPLEEM